MAFLYFKKEKVDFQVIEVGLGGRLDATNIVKPTISVITPIMLDHVSTLGNSIKLIAKEKAGIIKSKTPVTISSQKKEAMDHESVGHGHICIGRLRFTGTSCGGQATSGYQVQLRSKAADN